MRKALRSLSLLFVGICGLVFPHLAFAEPPVAGEGEPPITAHSGAGSSTYYRQVFEGEGITSGQPNYTIAERYYLTRDYEETTRTRQIDVTCKIESDGRIKKGACRQARHTPEGFRAIRIAYSASAFDDLPQFAPTQYDGEDRFNRTLRFTLTVPGLEVPDVDLTTGPLLPEGSYQAVLQRAASRLRYPVRAQRSEAEGYQTSECQVQTDYSLICRIIEFTPAENEQHFRHSLSKAFRRITMPPFVGNDRPTKGARFRFGTRWQMQK